MHRSGTDSSSSQFGLQFGDSRAIDFGRFPQLLQLTSLVALQRAALVGAPLDIVKLSAEGNELTLDLFDTLRPLFAVFGLACRPSESAQSDAVQLGVQEYPG